MKKEIKNSQGEVYYTVEYDPLHYWNYSNWIGYVKASDVVTACEEGLTLIQANRSPRLLNDNRQITGPWHEANDWIATTWMPQALSFGLKRFAHIVSPNVFSALSAQQLVSQVEAMNFEMRIFQDPAVAQEWLRTSLPE